MINRVLTKLMKTLANPRLVVAGVVLLAASLAGPAVQLTAHGPLLGSAGASSERLSPTECRTLYGQALSAYYGGQYRVALLIFDRLTGLMPSDLTDDLIFWQGECALRLGRLDLARQAFISCINQHPDSPKARAAAGRLSFLEAAGG